MPSMTARGLAIDILQKILQSQETLTATLQDKNIVAKWQSLSAEDKGFCYNLVMVTLRHYAPLMAFLETLPNKKMRFKRHDKVSLVLLTGMAQMIFLQTPLYAVQAESQKLLWGIREQAHKKFIHAMLQRGFERQGEFTTATPHVLHDWQAGWGDFYGEKQARNMAEAIFDKPPLDLHFTDEDALQGFTEQLADKEQVLFRCNNLLRIVGDSAVTELPLYKEGVWWVQDMAASVAVDVLAVGEGEAVLDLCAAPGGKTIQLINRGAKVVAVEKSPQKINILQENLKRMGMACDIVGENVLDYRPKQQFSAILLDAPCSASGTMRHHPELPLIKTPASAESLAEGQCRLLCHAYENLLTSGGRLVYSVCSLEKCEGEDVIKTFTDTHSDAKIASLSPMQAGEIPCHVGSDGCLRTFPSDWHDRGRLDGFFVTLIKKPPL